MRFSLILFALLSTACGSLKGQMQLGSDLSHPDARVLRSHICRGDNSAGRLYLALPEYSWLGDGAKERYMTDALDFKNRGECICATKGTCTTEVN